MDLQAFEHGTRKPPLVVLVRTLDSSSHFRRTGPCPSTIFGNLGSIEVLETPERLLDAPLPALGLFRPVRVTPGPCRSLRAPYRRPLRDTEECDRRVVALAPAICASPRLSCRR